MRVRKHLWGMGVYRHCELLRGVDRIMLKFCEALRMMKDRGFHLDSELLRSEGGLSPEEKEIRRNLWWSAYTWDKHISLTLGRGPTWRSYGGRFPGFLRESLHPGAWIDPASRRFHKGRSLGALPYQQLQRAHADHVPSNKRTRHSHLQLAVSPKRRQCSFHEMTRSEAAEIIDSILVKLYIGFIPVSQRSIELKDIEQRLTEWWIELPDVIRLNVSSLPEVCPPPHILSLKSVSIWCAQSFVQLISCSMLYRSAQILLHRQSLTSRLDNASPVPAQQEAQSRETCRTAAEEIHELSLLHGKTFEYRNLLYSKLAPRLCMLTLPVVSYCVFLAASVNAVEIYSRSAERKQSAATRLALNIHVLEHGANRAPGITKSIETIKRRLADSVVPSRAASPHPITPFAPSERRSQSLIQPVVSDAPTLLADLSPGYQDWFNGSLPAFPEQDAWFSSGQFAEFSGGVTSSECSEMRWSYRAEPTVPPMVPTGMEDIFTFPFE